jgi:Na+-driven multidrug efflux pump
LAFNTIGSFYSSVTAAYDMVLGTVLISILVSVVNITGDILLIPKIGISGAAVATTVAIGLGNILYIPLLKSKPELSYSRQRYRAVLMISPLLLCLGANLFLTAWYSKALVSIVIIAASLYLLPRLGIIKAETLTLLEIVEMPVAVKNTLRRILTVFIRKGITC